MSKNKRGSVGPVILPEELVEHHAGANPRDSLGERRNSLLSFMAGGISMMPKIPGSPSVFKGSERYLGDDLKDLALVDTLFVRQIRQAAEEYVNVQNKYNVEDKSGQLLYEIVETTEAVTRRLFRREQPFYLKILNPDGECVLDLVGDPGVGGLGAYVKVQRNAFLLGKVKQVSPFFACCNFSPSYNVLTDNNKLLFRIVWPRGRLKNCVFTDDFHIYSPTSKTCGENIAVGKICRESSVSKTYAADSYAVVINDNEMDRADKALIVAAVVMLDFQFFEGRKVNDIRRIWICILLVFCLLLICIIVIIFSFSITYGARLKRPSKYRKCGSIVFMFFCANSVLNPVIYGFYHFRRKSKNNRGCNLDTSDNKTEFSGTQTQSSL